MYKISKFLILSIIIALLVMVAPFFCSKANGQTLDSIPAIWRIPDAHLMRLVQPPFKDTIRVVMLVCDTTSSSWVDSGIVNGKLVQIGERHKHYRDRSAIWMYGYSVREYSEYYTGSNIQSGLFSMTPFYRHIEYLGEDKKPLQFKIVWMAKEVVK